MRSRHLRLVAGPVDDEAFATACVLAQAELLRLRELRCAKPGPEGQLAAAPASETAARAVRLLERGQR